MLRLRSSLRLGVRAAEHWHFNALSAAHVWAGPVRDDEPPDGTRQAASSPSKLEAGVIGLSSGHNRLSQGPLLPCGLLPATLWASGGGRCFSSSPADAAAAEVVQSVSVAAASGGSEVAAIASESAAPIAAIQYMLEAMHQYTGLPWWATIAATTLTARACLFPITLFQMRSTARMSAARPELEVLSKKMRENVTDHQATQEIQRQMSEVMKKYNVNPLKTMAGAFAQAPLFIGFFLAIRRMSENLPSFKEGGLFWFTDLSGADPTYLLPTICAATFLITVEVGAMEGMQGQPMAKTMKMAMRVLGVAMVPLTMSFEKALFCYWIPSNLFSLLQSSLLKVPKVKEALGIPTLNEAGQQPLPMASSMHQTEVVSSTPTSLQSIPRPTKKRRSKRK
ncbi:cytochrome oxidase biogenesis protein [Klebsormidium nitens]|uniref:Cytochrome oxidase biogenesis protein n=1 Tax=Klebsormidium nitens TaxID=105231 RepID=A0A1Y1ICP8_KLENI|nr:cytochrome oxidase biogenesis protein [Klebsormidium nitens]|eukprot:GAQ87219.1 cytochrome oxidase biogenesis protein [Klebsormidium nitens]